MPLRRWQRLRWAWYSSQARRARCRTGPVGWIWVALMAVVAASSFWTRQMRTVGPFHLLVDLRSRHAAARGVESAPPSGRHAQAHHDVHVPRRAGDRRAVHAGAWTDHAPG